RYLARESAFGRFETADTNCQLADNQFIELFAKRGLIRCGIAADEPGVRRQAETLLKRAEHRGFRRHQMNALAVLGDLARKRLAAQKARTYYTRARQIARELNRPVIEANTTMQLAEVDITEADFESAERRIQRADQMFTTADASRVNSLRSIRIVVAAGTEQWSEFDANLSAQKHAWHEGARLVSDHPWLLEMAGDYAAEAGHYERARAVWQIARDLWERLADDDAAAQVEAKLEHL
ncbi:MAG: hypothetical protein ABEN55_03015, partial [Bradymonadaceae bacterium]